MAAKRKPSLHKRARTSRPRRTAQDSEQWHRDLFDANPHPMWIYDQETLAFLAVNDAAIAHYGYSREEFLAMTIKDIRPAEDVPAFVEHVAELPAGLDRGGTWRHRKKDGSIIEVEVTSHTINFAGRRAEVVLANDVTERRLFENALWESEARFRALIEHSADAIALLAADGTVLYASPSTFRLLGFPVEDVVGRSVFEFLHPDDVRTATTLLEQLVQSPGKLIIREYRLRHADGSWRWMETISTNALAQPSVRAVIVNFRDVTERKRADHALRQSEALVRTAFDNAPFEFWVRDRSDVCIMANAAVTKHWGDVIGKRPQESGVSPEALAIWEASNRRALAGEVVEGEVELHEAGGTRWIRNIIAPFRVDGEIQGSLGFNIDITDRRRAEAALRQSEERYRLMVEAVPMLAWQCDAAGLCVGVNERWLEYTGQTPDKVLGNGWIGAVHPEDRARTLQAIEDDLAGGMIYQTEYRLRRASDGQYRWHLARALPVKDAQGQILAWFGCAADIEDQKRTAEQLEALVLDRTQALRDSESKFRTLTEQIPAVTYIAALDAASTTLYVSPQIEELLGVKPAEYAADPDLWRKLLHPEDSQRVLEAVAEAHRLGRMLDIEYRMLRRNGKTVWVRDRAVVVRDAAGKPLVLEGVMMDITPRKELERQVLAISEREQRRIAQDLHDGLCQLLTGTSFACELLEQRLAAKSPKEAAETRKIGDLLAEAVTQARAVARGLSPVEFEPDGLILALEQLAKSVTGLFHVPCSFTCRQPVLIHDTAAALHLYRIAQEAVNNALKHGKPKHVWIGLAAAKEVITLTIEDDGHGVPGELAETAGMGLRIMAHRAKMIGGSVEVRPGDGKGTMVTCTYPIRSNEQEPV